jgi:hypothetical protein
MRILIANDDGIYSPGIAALARVVPVARIAVRRDGRYDAYVRMPSRRVVVRLRAAATPATRAAVSRVRTLHR